jgi:hypothetical protein
MKTQALKLSTAVLAIFSFQVASAQIGASATNAIKATSSAVASTNAASNAIKASSSSSQ